MYICHCHVVTDTAIARAVGSGARTLAQVCRSTGAGQGCGACVFNVKRVVRTQLESLPRTAAPLAATG